MIKLHEGGQFLSSDNDYCPLNNDDQKDHDY